MTNRSKAKGTSAETACVRWLHLHGFPHADRQPLRGNKDAGDIALTAGLVGEVKAYRLPTGYPTPAQLALWLEQAAAEKANAGAKHCVLIVKRPGTTDVGRWYAFLPLGEFALLTEASHIPLSIDELPVMLPVAAMVAVLRKAGFGTPLEEEIAA
jgi:hypothetical protein